MPTALPAATVTMTDGRTVEFPAKRRIVKSIIPEVSGVPAAIRLDFRNGHTLAYSPQLPISVPKISCELALFGAMEILDSAAEEVEDQIEGVASRIARLTAGEWPTRGSGDDMAGCSVLLRALVEYTGKTPEVVREYLRKRTLKEKLELRRDPGLAPIVQRLEAAKREAKPSGVDTSALLAELQ